MNATAWRSHVLFGRSHELFDNSCVACLYSLVKKRGREHVQQTDAWRGGKESSKAGGRDKDSDRLANGQKQGLCQCGCLAFCTFDSGNAAVFVACLTPGNNLNVVAKFPCCMFDFFGFSMSHLCVVYCQPKVLCCPYVTGSRSCWPYVHPLLPRGLSCWRKSAPYVGLSGDNDQIQVLPLFEPMVPHFGLTYVYPIISHAGPSKINLQPRNAPF